MSTAEVQTHYSPSDLLEMPDGKAYELVDGVLVERNTGAVSSWVNNRIGKLLSIFVDDRVLGWVLDSEAGYHCFGEDRDIVRRPDVSFVERSRLPGGRLPDGYLTIAPDLAVEVISPNDRFYEVQSKVAEYLAAGVRLIWVINPSDRTVTVYSQDSDQPLIIRVGGKLTGGDVLPEFCCAVCDLFPPETE